MVSIIGVENVRCIEYMENREGYRKKDI